MYSIGLILKSVILFACHVMQVPGTPESMGIIAPIAFLISLALLPLEIYGRRT